MAKGFGEIIAESHMMWLKSAQEENPQCPLCGEVMYFNGAVWSCRYNRESHLEWLHERRSAAYECQKEGGVVFYIDIQTPPAYRWQNWNPDMQGVILAVTEDGWSFETCRGDFGWTYFLVRAPETWDRRSPIAPPRLKDWRWAEWTGK
ncbi:MAG: hypothetical protein QXS54_09505 [Candidatus Methanomethylicaceae archaeon]